ncbi:plasmid transfer protein TraA [Kitasatospora sp. NPDC058965]|uniref:plasmid transfer protein TraA n=1 Tax=Kitasatospora sp. NPDC058965 TaxID=3346682 RepID=UPI0036BCB5F3
MSTPTNNGRQWSNGTDSAGRQQQTRQNGANSGAGGGNNYYFQYTRSTSRVRGTGQGNSGPIGGQRTGAGSAGGSGGIGHGGGQGAGGGNTYSPLADPEFFTNADVRNYCEQGRSILVQVSFQLAMAHELLAAVLKEVPDPQGHAFGSQMRARRVAKNLKKAADDAKDCAANIARTYAAFQREYDPELSRVANRGQAPRRRFDFNG